MVTHFFFSILDSVLQVAVEFLLILLRSCCQSQLSPALIGFLGNPLDLSLVHHFSYSRRLFQTENLAGPLHPPP